MNRISLVFLFICQLSLGQNPLDQANSLQRNGNYDGAIKIHQKLIQDPESTDTVKSRAYLALSKLLEYKGDLEKGRVSLDSAEKYNENQKSNHIALEIDLIKAHYHLIFEENDQAREILEHWLSTIKAPGNEAKILLQLSTYYHQMGNYLKAMELIDRVEDLTYLTTLETSELVLMHKKRADNFYLLHKIEESLEEYKKAYAIARNYYSSNHDMIIRLHNDLGAVLADLNQIEEARFHLTKTIEQQTEIGANHSIADAFYYLSLLEHGENNMHLALNYAQKSLILFERIYGELSYWVCSGRVHMGDMLASAGIQELALEQYHSAFMANDSTFIDQNPGSNPEYDLAMSKIYYIVILMEKAKTQLSLYKSDTTQTEHLTNSYETYKVLMKAVEQQRVHYGAEEIQLEFGEDISEIYADALSCIYLLNEKKNNPTLMEEAFRIAEKGKAYYLSVVSNQPARNSLLESSGNKEILKTENPELYYQLYDILDLTLENIQNDWLKEDEMLIEYVTKGNQIHILTIMRDSVSHYSIESDFRLKDMVSKFRQSLVDRESAVSQAISELLGKLLIQSISIPEQINQLVIIPDRELHYLPFETLATSTGPLILDYSITYQHSAALGYNYYILPFNGIQSFYGFAPEFLEHPQLTGSIQEVNTIADLLNGSAYTGKNATLENLQASLKDHGILHLSSHTFINDDEPEESYLLLRSDTSTGDIPLHAATISKLDIKSTMVTLSSCNTGVGKIKGGEGVLSLARDFASAGSPSIVMSLWAVPDQVSSDIMIGFYEYLKKGMSKGQALRQAKLDYLAGSDNISSNPYFWAPLVVIGDDRPLKFREPIPIWVWLLGIIALGIPAVIIFRKRSS